MSKVDLAFLWIWSALAALALVTGKLGLLLFGIAQDPPADPLAVAHWRRRRRWLAYSELAALPAFATIAVAATIYFHLPAVASVGISMALGALGFGFCLNGVQMIARRKLERLGSDQ